jgi:hypothetical protein
LDYDHVDTDEAISGEGPLHTVQERVNDIRKNYLRVEDYFLNGALDPPEDESLDYESRPWGRRRRQTVIVVRCPGLL